MIFTRGSPNYMTRTAKGRIILEMREMAGIGQKTSRLGMGLMRMPVKDGKIDFEPAREMVDRLMASGVTYYDTAFFYHEGQSEDFAGMALTGRYPRESYTIATKLPMGEVNEEKDNERVFNTQLGRLGLDRIDFYLLHGINLGGWRKAVEMGSHEFQHRMKREGKISYAGFSFHGKKEDFPVILDEGRWDFVQIQLNYYDWYAGDAEFLYREALKRGIAVIVMEPVRGGGLVKMHPGALACLDGLGTPASAALRWVAGLPGVDVVLSGMSDMAQVNENIEIFNNPVQLSDLDNAKILRAVEKIKELPTIPCTSCNYCDKCPQDIPIPQLFRGYNEIVRFDNTWFLGIEYFKNANEGRRADACIECGACEEICPQGIPIIRDLKMVHGKALEVRRD